MFVENLLHSFDYLFMLKLIFLLHDAHYHSTICLLSSFIITSRYLYHTLLLALGYDTYICLSRDQGKSLLCLCLILLPDIAVYSFEMYYFIHEAALIPLNLDYNG